MAKEQTRTVVKGFRNSIEEETEEPVAQEENFIPLPREEEQNPVNITWLIWFFGIVMFLNCAFTITIFALNTSILKELRKQRYEQRGNRNNTSECTQSLYISRTADGVWEIQDCTR